MRNCQVELNEKITELQNQINLLLAKIIELEKNKKSL